MQLSRREFFKGLAALTGATFIPVDIGLIPPNKPIDTPAIIEFDNRSWVVDRFSLIYEPKYIKTEWGLHSLKSANITIKLMVSGIYTTDQKPIDFIFTGLEEGVTVTGNGDLSSVEYDGNGTVFTISGCSNIYFHKWVT